MARILGILGLVQLVAGVHLWADPATYSQGWLAFGSGCVFLLAGWAGRRRGGGRR